MSEQGIIPADMIEATSEEDEIPDEAEIRAELDAINIGDTAGDDEEKAKLYRFLKRRFLLVAEQARLKEQMAAMVKSLDARIKGLDYWCRREAEDITRRLIGTGKAKSIKTPFGTAGFRTTGGRLTIVDEVRAVAFATLTDGLSDKVIVTRKLPAAAAQEWLKATGECIPGAEITEQVETFYAK